MQDNIDPIRIRRRQVCEESYKALVHEGFAPAMAKLFASRGVRNGEDVSISLAGLPTWALFAGMQEAASIVADAIRQAETIVVLSDYDADGATGCAVLVRALRAMKGNVDYVIPLRDEHGYGLTPDIVPQVLAACPHLVITVDNGISSIEGVRMLREKGVRVVVTDHHLPPPQLPEADAIVNPNQVGCAFPSKAVAGVGVAFYLACAVRAVLDGEKWFTDGAKPNFTDLLSLVALGTVADLVPLDHVNRILVANGLKGMRTGNAALGIKTLARVARRDIAGLVTSDLGFALGPRLNAVGRLADMKKGVRCLVTQDEQLALTIATELEKLNVERRAIQEGIQAEALDDIGEPTGLGICVAGDWHAGVVGIVAGQLKEKFRRPAIVFSQTDDKGFMKGSGRSVAGYHMRDALARIDAAATGLISKYGGHAAAAGLSVPMEEYERFRDAFLADCAQHVPREALDNVIETDGELQAEEISKAFVTDLQSEVWGQGFPEPVFDGTFDVVERKVVGEKHLKLSLTPISGVLPNSIKNKLPAIWFNAKGVDLPNRCRFAYRLSLNEWNGITSVQAMILGAETSG